MFGPAFLRRPTLRIALPLLACLGLGASAKQLRYSLMSWLSHNAANNDELVDALAGYGIIRSGEVEEAMRKVDRRDYSEEPQLAYVDCPHPIGFGATISAPHMHAHCLEMLRDKLQPGAKVLDVGSGSGYLTAVIAHMVTRGSGAGSAVGVEHIPELVEKARRNVQREPRTAELYRTGHLQLEVGDGFKGWPAGAPFDAIHVGAAAERVPPALLEQLKPGGRLLLPVGPAGGLQSMALVTKREDGSFVRQDAMSVMYVPLTSKAKQLAGDWDSD